MNASRFNEMRGANLNHEKNFRQPPLAPFSGHSYVVQPAAVVAATHSQTHFINISRAIMTPTITNTTRYRRLLPTVVARVGVLRFGVTRSRDTRVELAITPRYDVTAIAGERTP